ncbi:Cystinosin-like protein [Frankliniella fusca]|uniref:Cystinosin homolog n=1 Tax=Frankliniella fusca TaxID=407009 RepID=A0AAE1HFP7_9NEOP|nr:Cystinosin-like protein [Frankliniella fusca]
MALCVTCLPFLGILLGLPLLINSDLVMDPKALTIVVNQQATFNLISKTKISEDVNVQLMVSYADIVVLEPSEIKIPANAPVPFTQIISVTSKSPGYVDVTANASSSSLEVDGAFLKVTSEHSSEIEIISVVVGWIYFVVWSVSFYPQIFENWRRKSVVGLNFDFLTLNLTGFTLYSLFNCGLYWIPSIQEQYFERNPRSGIPVQPNDIFFGLHAVAVTLITIFQCFLYERGGQSVSIVARSIQGAFFIFLFISMLCSVFKVILWLDFLYYCSYVKLCITLIKYIPQGYMNFRRKSTVGWSIGNILCDFTGGVLSILQMVLDAYNYHDWASIFLSPTKFGLGLISIIFDVFFMVQHYILYRNQAPLHSGYERIDGSDSSEAPTTITPHEASVVDECHQSASQDVISSESVT